MNILPSCVYKAAGKAINKMAKTSYIKGKFDQSVSDPARFAAAMLVTSIVSKDLVGCGFYTYQSLNNDKIPEEKRKFVAALDLVNGILMVGGQFAIGKIIDAKVTPKLMSKFTGIVKDKITGIEKTVNPNAAFHPDNIEKTVRNIAKTHKMENVNVQKVVEQINKLCRTPFEKGFGILAAAIATTALTKRTIVPFLSTPIAGWITDLVDKKKDKNQDNTEVNRAIATAAYNKTEPTIKQKEAVSK